MSATPLRAPCRACGTSAGSHGGRGLCRRCYRRAWAGAAATRRWSKGADTCSSCGRSDSPHAAHGICSRCWQRGWRAIPENAARGARALERYNASDHGRAVRRNYAALEDTRRRKWLDNLRRREMREGVWTPLPDGYVEKALEIFEHRCARCGAAGDLELDHHRPMEAGHSLYGNSVPLCRSCNARKHTRHPERFYDRWTLAAIAARLWELREWLASLAPEAAPC
jgi:5-methylcytosine-specific restriction endonuclease McrA